MLRLFRAAPDNNASRPNPSREALLEAHGGLVFGLCRRLAGEEAEDCYQEIWEKIFRALPDFDPSGAASLKTWIGTLARRHLIDRHRRRSVRGETQSPIELPSPCLQVDERLAQAQRHARLEAALAQLPLVHRRVIIGYHLQHIDLPTLAEEEGVAVGTIKSRLHRGRQRLAQLLRERSE